MSGVVRVHVRANVCLCVCEDVCACVCVCVCMWVCLCVPHLRSDSCVGMGKGALKSTCVGATVTAGCLRFVAENTLSCSFFARAGCERAGVWGLVYNVGLAGGFWVGLLLNYESANYTMILNLLVPVVCSTFWLVFPALNPAAANTPLWSVLPSLVLSIVSLVLWKAWERDTSDGKATHSIELTSLARAAGDSDSGDDECDAVTAQ